MWNVHTVKGSANIEIFSRLVTNQDVLDVFQEAPVFIGLIRPKDKQLFGRL